MNKKDKPNKVTAKLRVVVTGEFYDDDATEETLRYCVEQDLEDAGFEVEVELLKKQEAVEPKKENDGNHEPCTSWWYVCGDCGRYIDPHDKFCRHCGREVDWDGSDA